MPPAALADSPAGDRTGGRAVSCARRRAAYGIDSHADRFHDHCPCYSGIGQVPIAEGAAELTERNRATSLNSGWSSAGAMSESEVIEMSTEGEQQGATRRVEGEAIRDDAAEETPRF